MRNRWFIISHASAILLGLLTAIISWWLPWRAKVDQTLIKQVFWDSWLDLQTPIPWLGIVIALWGVSVYRSEEFSKRLGNYSQLEDSFDLQEKQLFDESDAHWDTKLSYYDSLKSSLKYILTSPKTGFTDNCRVTVYRVHEADTRMFRNIFRHAGQYRFDDSGRDAIPISQGVVGLAYATAGIRSFRTGHEFGSDEYWDELAVLLSEADIELPPKGTRMPSVHLVVKAITDHGTGKQVGVVAYESINEDDLQEDGIEKHLSDEDQNISRFVSHLATLDDSLNPFPYDAYVEDIDRG